MSEKLADEYGQEIKYGIGDPAILKLLSNLSEESANFDEIANQRLRVTTRADFAKRNGRLDLWKLEKKKLKALDSDLRNAMYKTRILVSKFDEEQAK